MTYAIFYVTHADRAAAQRLGDELLRRRLIACANYFPIQSSYWWQGAIEAADECVSLFKTSRAAAGLVATLVEQLHPYTTPCVTRLVVEANAAYVQWINESVQPVQSQ